MVDDPSDDDESPTVPLGVRIAAMVWIVYGGVWIGVVLAVSFCVMILVALGRGGFVCCLLPPMGVCGWAFVQCGQNARRENPAELGTEAGYSLVLGAVNIGLAVFVVYDMVREGYSGSAPVAFAGFLWCPGAALVTAGVLVLRARSQALARRKRNGNRGGEPRGS